MFLNWQAFGGDTSGRDCAMAVELWRQGSSCQKNFTEKVALKRPFISDTGEETLHVCYSSLWGHRALEVSGVILKDGPEMLVSLVTLEKRFGTVVVNVSQET